MQWQQHARCSRVFLADRGIFLFRESARNSFRREMLVTGLTEKIDRCGRWDGAGSAKSASELGAVSSGAVPAGVEVASADAGGGCSRGCGRRRQHEHRGGVRLRPGGPPLRGSRRPLLSSAAAAAAAATAAELRSSAAPSSPEPGGFARRGRRPLQEQQHRRPQVKGQATPGGTRTRQARVNSLLHFSSSFCSFLLSLDARSLVSMASAKSLGNFLSLFSRFVSSFTLCANSRRFNFCTEDRF